MMVNELRVARQDGMCAYGSGRRRGRTGEIGLGVEIGTRIDIDCIECCALRDGSASSGSKDLRETHRDLE